MSVWISSSYPPNTASCEGWGSDIFLCCAGLYRGCRAPNCRDVYEEEETSLSAVWMPLYPFSVIDDMTYMASRTLTSLVTTKRSRRQWSLGGERELETLVSSGLVSPSNPTDFSSSDRGQDAHRCLTIRRAVTAVVAVIVVILGFGAIVITVVHGLVVAVVNSIAVNAVVVNVIVVVTVDIVIFDQRPVSRQVTNGSMDADNGR